MRAMATIRQIAEIKPIPEADLIEAYRVDGWWVVDSKTKYQVGDLVIYCEVDSWIPTAIAPFLSKGKDPKVYEGVQGERLRTVRLKKQLSQGLLLPMDLIPADIVAEGEDMSNYLGITKWEMPISAQLAGLARGNFPSEIPKTDQERVQNITFSDYLNEEYEVTEKLHGSSCTFFLDLNNDLHVCSRNLDLKETEGNAYWRIARQYKVEEVMKHQNLMGYAIQGELCGEGINGNNYKQTLEFFVFDVYSIDTGYLTSCDRIQIINKLGLKHVPIIHNNLLLNTTVEDTLLNAEGQSVLADCRREGLVFKALYSPKTFKAVSNAWLLKYD